MVQILQLRRNTTTELSSERGSIGEIIIDTNKNTAVVMDGTTSGGHPMAKESDIPTKVSDLINDTGFITSAAVFSGNYNDLTNKPSLFSGAYADLTGKPTLFSGAYADLTGKPTLFSGSYNDLSDKPTLFSGVYADLTGLPTLFDGQYSSLSGIPSTFTPAAHTQDFSTITNTPTTIAGYGITDSLFTQGDSTVNVGNTHSISAVSDTIMGLGPNNLTIDFGTALQNHANIENVSIIRLKPTTELRIILGDNSEWVFGTGGGLDFPDFSTQTTAYPGQSSLTSIPYVDGTGGAWSNTAPTTVSSAIDRIAAAVSLLLGGTID